MAYDAEDVTLEFNVVTSLAEAPTAKLRVGLFTDSPGIGNNGVSVSVNYLRVALSALGHEAFLVAPSLTLKGQHQSDDDSKRYALAAVRLPGVHPSIATGWGFRGALEDLAKERFDVVHVHGVGPISLLGIYLAKREKLPLVLTWHTDIAAYLDHYPLLKYAAPAWRRLIDRLFADPHRRRNSDEEFQQRNITASSSHRNLALGTRRLLQAADAVTAPSEKATGQLGLLGSTTRIRTIPGGVDFVPEYTESPSNAIGTKEPTNGARLLYVGRLAPEKGIDLLLDAFLIVREVAPEATLRLVGDASNARSLAGRLNRIRNDPSVILSGEVEPSKLSTFYSEADMFVFPSTTDTQALVLHEAAYAGLPIVSVDNQLVAVVAPGKNAVISEPTAPLLANAILTMLNFCSDDLYLAQAAETGRRLAGIYTSQRQAKEFISLYRETIAEK